MTRKKKSIQDNGFMPQELSQDEIEYLTRIVVDGQKNLVNYRKLFLPTDKHELPPAYFHYVWSEILLNSKDSFVIEAYRESGKTQYVLRAYPLYCLTFPEPERSYIVLILNNTKIASKKLKEITREFLSNKFISSHVLKIVEESGEAFQVRLMRPDRTEMEVRIEAYGKGGSIRGASWGTKRPDIIIIDDIQDTEDARSDKILDDDWKWFLDDIKFLGTRTRFFMIGNNLGEKCIIERVIRAQEEEKDNLNAIDDPVKRELAELMGMNFKTMRIPVARDIVPGSKTAWPEQYPIEKVIASREFYHNRGELTIWTRNMMCECIAQEDKIFTEEMFMYYAPADALRIAGACNIYLRCDPGVSTASTADYSAFVIIGINPDNYWFFFDVVYKQMKQSEKLDTVFDLITKWPVSNVGIENSKEGIILMQDLREQMPKRNKFFQLREIKLGNQSKVARIEALEPRFTTGTVYFPEQASWLPETKQEFLMFSRAGRTTLHDDIPDATAQMLYHTTAPINSNRHMNENTIKYQQLPRQAKMMTVVK